MPARRVIVTRPAREAARWVDGLRALGLDAQALPLIVIDGAPDPAALHAAWRQLTKFDALMFVSAAAVEHFFAGANAAVFSASRARCWATGPGTARALRAAGVPAERIDVPADDAPAFDSEALWTLVQGQVHAGSQVLIVRGSEADGQAAGRPWLARTLAAAGVHCDTVVSYRRRVPTWDARQQAQARVAASDGSVWLFGSSQAIANLRQLLPGSDWRQAVALTTHERIAQAARDAGFGNVQCVHSSLAAVAASIESLA